MRDTLAPRPYLRRGVAHKELHSPPIARSEPFDRHRAAPGLGRGDQRALDLWLPRTSNVLRRLRLRAFSDSLQACGRSSSRYFTRSDFWSSRAPCCPWRSWRSATNWPSSVDRGARVFASRQPIESCGRGSRRHGAAGTRRSQPLRNAFPENDAPRYLRHDRDSVLADVATTIERMNIQEVRTTPRSPWQNAYVERVIGSLRRECLDHVVVVNAAGLHRLVTAYVTYYHFGSRSQIKTRPSRTRIGGAARI